VGAQEILLVQNQDGINLSDFKLLDNKGTACPNGKIQFDSRGAWAYNPNYSA